MAWTAIYPIVKVLVKDAAGKLADSADYDTLIAQAVKGRYSADRPLVKAKDYSGDGSTYAFDLPAGTGTPAVYGWIDGFSSVVSLEYPTGDRPQTFLDPREIRIDFSSATAKKLFLDETTPGTGKTMRLRYTTRRETEADVISTDLDAVAKLAASLCCRALAGLYAQTSDSTIGADVVNYRTKSQEYTSLADKYERDYVAQISGQRDEAVKPASGRVNWDSRLQSGYDFLTHPRRGR